MIFHEYIGVLNSVEKSEVDGLWRFNPDDAFGQYESYNSIISNEEDKGSTKSWRQQIQDTLEYNLDVDYRSTRDGNSSFQSPTNSSCDNSRMSHDSRDDRNSSRRSYNDEQTEKKYSWDGSRRRNSNLLVYDSERDRWCNGDASGSARLEENSRRWHNSRHNYDRSEVSYNDDCWDSYNTHEELREMHEDTRDVVSIESRISSVQMKEGRNQKIYPRRLRQAENLRICSQDVDYRSNSGCQDESQRKPYDRPVNDSSCYDSGYSGRDYSAHFSGGWPRYQ